MPFIRFDNWRRLPGIEAEIWLHGDLKRTGVVDAASEDSTIAWVAADATGPRRLLERANGFELRISPEQLVLRAELQAHAVQKRPS